MNIIDAHLHLDDRIEGPAIVAASQLNDALAAAGIARGIVLHLEMQRWPVEEFAEAIAACDRLEGLINVHPDHPNAERDLRNGLEKLGFIGLKLHPRLQHFDVDSAPTKRLVAAAGEMGAPVLVDAFPDGDWLMQGFNPLSFADLAKSCPNTRIILGHFGGHHCIDVMMLAKRLPNVHVDLSFSWLYYRGSAVPMNLAYCCRSMRYERIFYGSDYPDRPIDISLRDSMALMAEQGIAGDALDRLMYKNAEEFFAWPTR
jgi:predicted TIM-barrel fold metal-dependent hydrolase